MLSHTHLDLLSIGTAVAAAALGGIVAAVMVRRRWPMAWCLVPALAATTVAAVVVGLAGKLTGELDSLGVLHVVYVGVVVGVPAVCLGWLLGIRRRTRANALAVIGLLLAPLGWYATNIEPKWLRVDRVEVDVAGITEGDEPLVVGVLADLQTRHIGEHERNAADQIMEAEPDLVVLPGDLFQGTNAEFDAVADDYRSLFASLEAPYGDYAVPGNVDTPYFAGRAVEGTEIALLVNDIVTLDVRGRTVAIAGIKFAANGGGEPEQEIVDRLEATEADVRLLIAHTPDAVSLLEPGSTTDLVISGHTHGGQVAVPFLGWRPNVTEVPTDVAAGGLHDVDGHEVYVSTGVGVERAQAPVIRFGVRPSVAIITLR